MNKRLVILFFLGLVAAGCKNTTATDSENDPSTSRVVVGAERLFDPEFFSLIKGKRVGLITNHTGLLPDGRHLADVLHGNEETSLTVLFGPEHGIRGDADSHVADGTDVSTGLPVISLYGKVRKPTAEMLKDVDVLVFDIQDIGARFYTYIATMNHVLESAAENNIPYVVLDRPNAIGGEYVDGPVGEGAGEPVSGINQIPVTHGMTVGELAKMFNGERAKRNLPMANLTVVAMKNYQRGFWYDETGLPWIKPSPNMLTLTTAAFYPMTCLLEGTNISEARGTLHPFEHVAAPWIDGAALAEELNSYKLAGITFEAATFVPDSVVDGIRIHPPKFVGQECSSAHLTITDRNTFKSVEAAVYMLRALHTQYPDKFEWKESRMDRLWRTPKVREQIQHGVEPTVIISQWKDELDAFKAVRAKYLIY